MANGAAGEPAARAATPAAPPQPTATHMVAMRDGIRLATDLHLPPGAGAGDRFPVIIERTPYGRAGVSGSEMLPGRDQPLTRAELGAMMAARGYAVVMQDVRGRGGSEGVFAKYINEAEDGVDSFRWLLGQGWCDGRICTMGLSYGAHTQLAAAVAGAPGIAAMVIDTGGLMDLWRHSLRLGGGFELKQVAWSFRHAAKSLRAAGREAEAARIEAADIRAAILTGDWREGRSPLAAAPDYERYLLDIWAMGPDHPALTGPATRAAGHFAGFPDVPVLLVGSWFDPYASNMLELAAAIRAQGGRLRQIMGPWLHGRRSTGRVGEADFGAAATIEAASGRDWVSLRLDWFDAALGRGPQPLGRDLVYQMEPAAPPGWPAMGGHWADRLGRGTPPDWLEALVTLDFDPAQPFPTLGGGVTSGGAMMAGGMFDHRDDPRLTARGTLIALPPAERERVLSGVLSLPVELLSVEPPGPVDLSAVLLVETAEGALVNLTDGFLRLDGTPGPAVIDMLATNFRLPAGARLYLSLSTANFPRIDMARRSPYRLRLRLCAAGHAEGPRPGEGGARA